jgi:hypothetical protein
MDGCAHKPVSASKELITKLYNFGGVMIKIFYWALEEIQDQFHY